MALALAAMLLALAAWDRGSPPLLIGLLCGFSVLARVDTLVMAAIFAAAFVAQRRFGDVARLAIGVALVAGPVALWNAIAFGHPLPDSGVIKAHYRGVESMLQAASTVGMAVPRILLPGRVVDWCLAAVPLAIWPMTATILVICGRAAWRRENRVLGWLAVALALPYLGPHRSAGDRGTRPLLLPGMGHPGDASGSQLSPGSGRAGADRSRPRRRRLRALGSHDSTPAASFVGSAQVLAPAVIERLVPAGQFIGSFDAGALGYFSPRPVINLDGLANHEIVELRRTCRLPYATCLRDYLRAKGIGVLAGGTGFGWTGHFHDWTAWERLYESPPLVDGSRLVILRIPPTAK